MGPSLRKVAYYLAIALLACVCLVTILAASAAVASQTAWGRERVRVAIASLLSDEIPGRLEIAHVDHIGFDGVSAREAVFYDPENFPVIRVDELRISLDPLSLLHGDLVFPSAVARGGSVWVQERMDGATRLERAFAEGTGEPNFEQPRITLQQIRVSKIRVVVTPKKSESVVITNVSGRLNIDRPPGEGVKVDLHEVSGHVVRGLRAFGKVRVKGLHGKVRGMVRHVMHLEARVVRNGHWVTGYFDYYDRDEKNVIIHLDTDEFSMVNVMAWAYDTFANESTVDIQLGRP